jgi:protease I
MLQSPREANLARILMVVASREFRDEEYLTPRALFDGAGHEVTVASSVARARGALGTWVPADRALAECRAAEYDAVVFVGGTGASEYFDSRTAHRLCRDAVAAGKVLAAICMAPSILANAGALDGMSATCYPTQERHLADCGAVLAGTPVATAGRIVTADGPAHARDFAAAVLKALGS